VLCTGVLVHLFGYWLYGRPVERLAVTLQDFPRELGEWRAIRTGLDEEIEEALHLEDFWSATYARSGGHSVTLLLGYYPDESVAKLHQPTVCYPAAGWTAAALEQVEFAAVSDPSRAIRMNRLLAERGEDRQIVLYWFHMPGTTVADPSISKLHRLKGMLQGGLSRSMVKVQIGVPASDSVEAAMARAEPFIGRVLTHLGRHLGPTWAVPEPSPTKAE